MSYSETPVTILNGLNRLAYNLWWTWSDNAQRIFGLIDNKLWKEVERNPVVFLKRLSRESLNDAVSRKEVIDFYRQVISEFDSYLNQGKTWFATQYPGWENMRIAYFSAEFGLHESVPIYSGGLGVLAGDHCKAASDLGLPFTAVGLLYRQGYFVQQINKKGQQEAVYIRYNFADMPLQLLKNISGNDIIISVELPGRTCFAKIWKIEVGRIPLFLLDADIEENSPDDRRLTNNLYGGDHDMRISQEILLGMGGVRALDAIGIKPTVWHMNEGHSVFLGLERIVNFMKQGLKFAEALEAVKANTIFTTHTPVPAGNDAFSLLMIEKYFKRYLEKAGIKPHEFMSIGLRPRDGGSDLFSLTILAFHLSAHSNGVSRLHGHVSRTIWNDVWHGVPLGEIPIGHITNGVHTLTWLAPSIANLFDKYMGSEWRQIIDVNIWDKVHEVPSAELWNVRNELKEVMIKSIHHRLSLQSQRLLSNTKKGKSNESVLNPKALTLGFARRFATYKRATLIFRDMERLKKILNNKERPVQIIFAGKAHPADRPGQEFIARVYEISQMKEFAGKIFMVEGYDMHLARHLVSGVDIWLNTPRRPYEASGTSGQKAGLNGAVNFSVLDGWWVEGYNEKERNGWSIGGENDFGDEELQDKLDSEDMYEKLEKEIVPMYYNRNKDGVPEGWMQVVKESIKTTLPQFSTARMVRDYFNIIYMPAHIRSERLAGDNFEKAKSLADWKSWMKSNWEYIKVVSIEKGEHIRDELGNDTQYYEIIITIDLGPLSPSEVAIEIFKGVMDKKGEFKSRGLIPMKRLGEIWEGFYSYAGIVPSDEREGWGFFFHIVPTHPDLGNKYELGLIKTTYVAATELGTL